MQHTQKLADFCADLSMDTLPAEVIRKAKLYGFDKTQTLNAIANAGYLLPISMAEHLMGGFTIKIVQGGQAASAGIKAAGLRDGWRQSRGCRDRPKSFF